MTWIKYLFLIFLLTGCSVPLGGDENAIYDEKIRNKEIELTTEERIEKQLKGKHKMIDKVVEADGTEYKVDHIVVWDGNEIPKSDGYQVYIKRKDGMIKSYGEGDKSLELSHDWKFEDKIISTTSATSTQ